ncbi:MAG: MFS transporter [Defluviicoccus sp.]|nr:MFS transporter [Defluviicoccus sp.]MDE0384797.1 MFS transporter [Defluviicoccus sp.]
MKRALGFEGVALAFGNPDFRLYALASIPSLLGTWIQRVAVLWLAWELTESGTWLGVLAFADMLPVIVITPIAGAFADRLDRLASSRLLQYGMSAQALALASLVLAGMITIEVLVLLTFVSGILHAIFHPFRQALIANMVRPPELVGAIAVNSMMWQAARSIGPALAGVAILAWGAGVAIAINVVTYVPFLIALHLISVRRHEAVGGKSLAAIPREIVDGIRLAASHPAIGPIFVLLFAISLAGRAATELLPGFAGAVFERDAMGLAWLTSAGGVGAMLGALFAVRRSTPERLPRRVIGSAVLLVAALAGFVATDIFALALPCLALSAFALAMGGVGIQTIVQYTVPEAFRGRVLGLYGLLWLGCPAVGLLAVGALADVWGFQAALASALLLPAAAWVWIAGRRRGIEAGLAPP